MTFYFHVCHVEAEYRRRVEAKRKEKKKGMGVIKEGRVTGVVPSREAFAVHYPGYPCSISRAVDTLGGLQGLLKVLSFSSTITQQNYNLSIQALLFPFQFEYTRLHVCVCVCVCVKLLEFLFLNLVNI